jgi:hypothetical protein
MMILQTCYTYAYVKMFQQSLLLFRALAQDLSQLLLLRWCYPCREDDIPPNDHVSLSLGRARFRYWHTLSLDSGLLTGLDNLKQNEYSLPSWEIKLTPSGGDTCNLLPSS